MTWVSVCPDVLLQQQSTDYTDLLLKLCQKVGWTSLFIPSFQSTSHFRVNETEEQFFLHLSSTDGNWNQPKNWIVTGASPTSKIYFLLIISNTRLNPVWRTDNYNKLTNGSTVHSHTYTLLGRECTWPHSPGAGPRARSRPGSRWASRVGPERQNTFFPIFFKENLKKTTHDVGAHLQKSCFHK